MDILTSATFSTLVSQYLYWFFLGLVMVYLTQRPHREHGRAKQTAVSYYLYGTLFLYFISITVVEFNAGDIFFYLGLGFVLALFWYFRKSTFPFSLRCKKSGRFLDMKTFLYDDRNILPEYLEETESEEVPNS